MEKIVPVISTTTVGPLGIAHLPRLWLKVLLHYTGRLPEGYRHGTGGSDERTLDDLGIDRDTFLAFMEAELPSYLECEAWVRKHATKLDPETIAEHNEISKRDKPEHFAAPQRAYVGLDDPTVRNATLLNDLDDWATLHALVTKGTIPRLAASSLNAVFCERLKALIDETGATHATLHVDLPAFGLSPSQPAGAASRDGAALDGKTPSGKVEARTGPYSAWISVYGGNGEKAALERALADARSALDTVLGET